MERLGVWEKKEDVATISKKSGDLLSDDFKFNEIESSVNLLSRRGWPLRRENY